jgi:hypothetical protein
LPESSRSKGSQNRQIGKLQKQWHIARIANIAKIVRIGKARKPYKLQNRRDRQNHQTSNKMVNGQIAKTEPLSDPYKAFKRTFEGLSKAFQNPFKGVSLELYKPVRALQAH